MKTGAQYLGKNRCEFTVWAPLPETVDLVVRTPHAGAGRRPPRSHVPCPWDERTIEMARDARGCWHATADGVPSGTLYSYRLNGKTLRPDPASHSQPEGVHGPSEVVDHGAFAWSDRTWAGIPFDQMIIYEIHTGTFTPEGTFSAIIPRLEELAKLGVTAIELMPVAQFPGPRNWGYDGAYPYAVQTSYGGPDALKRLVDACHRHGLAAVLDVVYNHLGPEGCYMLEFGPYFTEKHLTPWGNAMNYDNHDSDQVRDFFIENALVRALPLRRPAAGRSRLHLHRIGQAISAGACGADGRVLPPHGQKALSGRRDGSERQPLRGAGRERRLRGRRSVVR